MFATIGYEKSTLEDFIGTLKAQRIQVLVDIRERAQSRRPGFSKTALAEAVHNAGIEYLHFRALGDPKDGRDAARAGLFDKFKRIFSEVLEAEPAREALNTIEALAKSRRICLMCYERDHRNCHRKLVSDVLKRSLGVKVLHLGVTANGSRERQKGRMLHPRQSAAA